MDPTPSQTIGPFFKFALPVDGGAHVVAEDHPGAVRVTGRVLDGAGQPVPDALIEIWQADPQGQTAPTGRWFGRCPTDDAGRFVFVTVKPGALAPHAPHLNMTVFARGLLRHLMTRMYFPDEAAANASDPVLAGLPEPDRRGTLIAERHPAAAHLASSEAGGETAGGIPELSFDIRLQGERETVFFGD
jgi:protocatechuate 3,4-dioxygenase alpha subunit